MITHSIMLEVVRQDPQDYEPFGLAEKGPDCSNGCLDYLRLSFPHTKDWGVCGNSESHRSGLLTFEHQGCPHFWRVEEGE